MGSAKYTRRVVAGGLAFATVFDRAAPPLAATPEGRLVLRRGIGVYHMMQAPERIGPEGMPVWPAFAGAVHDMSDAQILALKQAGFDFVRLTVAPDVFLRATGADADALYASLRANVARFTSQGLSVVVALMPGDAVRGFTNADFANNTKGVFDALCGVVRRCALVLRDVAPGWVAVEPLNEPALWGFAEERWSAMQRRLHEAVRAADPGMPVVLTGAQSGGLEGLLTLDPSPYRGSKVVYSFHYYEPHIFTHQHAGETFRYLTGVGWPPRPEGLSAALARAKVAIAADPALTASGREAAAAKMQSLLASYYRGGDSPRVVKQDFARVAVWADGHGIDRSQILLGEFGVTRTLGAYAGASAADAAGWLRTVREAAEQNGFGWSLWAFSGPVSMTLANEYPAQTFDLAVLRALGLRPTQPSRFARPRSAP